MTKVEAEDIVELYDKVWQQFQEDRDAIRGQYADLKAYISDNNERYAISGDTLAKYAELMVKQTGQIIELIKLAKKSSDNPTSLTEDDLKMIASKIEGDKE